MIRVIYKRTMKLEPVTQPILDKSPSRIVGFMASFSSLKMCGSSFAVNG